MTVDAARFAEIVREHGPAMLAVARRILPTEEDARDAVQDAFLQAYRNFDRFRGEASLGTWLHRVVRNAALMKIRRASHRRETSLDDLLPRFDETGHHLDPVRPLPVPPDQELVDRERRDRVRAAIAKLPEAYRTVLVLRDLEEMTTAEVAQALGISEAAVRVRLHRARKALMTLLAREME
jgi:RNA polymerase sigma-70 factor (ECF subfamily)